MKYWLMKNEPLEFGIDHLIKIPGQVHYWDGIRNYQARNMIRDEMKVGDLAFFYHSSCKPPGIVGIIEIVKEAYPDFTAFDPNSNYYDPGSSPSNPRWLMVDVKLKQKFPRMITLQELREKASLSGMRVLQKGNRLSITPVSKQEWETILSMV